jgi:hypothetical protein
MKLVERRAGAWAAVGLSAGVLLSAGTSFALAAQGRANTKRHGAQCSRHPRIVEEVNLDPPHERGKAAGVAEVLSDHCQDAMAILAQGLRPNTKHNAYAVWLCHTRKDCRLLGFVSPPVGRRGRLRTEGGLPRHWRHFHRLIISLETKASPNRPHHVALIGRIHPGSSG